MIQITFHYKINQIADQILRLQSRQHGRLLRNRLTECRFDLLIYYTQYPKCSHNMCWQKEVLESMLCLFLERIFFLTSNHFSFFWYRRYAQTMTQNNKEKQTNKRSFKLFSRAWVPCPISNIILLSAVFDVLPVCVIKSSYTVLFKHNCQFSVHKC